MNIRNTDEQMRKYIEDNIKNRNSHSQDGNPNLGRWFHKMNEVNFCAGDSFSLYHAKLIDGIVYIKKFVSLETK